MAYVCECVEHERKLNKYLYLCVFFLFRPSVFCSFFPFIRIHFVCMSHLSMVHSAEVRAHTFRSFMLASAYIHTNIWCIRWISVWGFIWMECASQVYSVYNGQTLRSTKRNTLTHSHAHTLALSTHRVRTNIKAVSAAGSLWISMLSLLCSGRFCSACVPSPTSSSLFGMCAFCVLHAGNVLHSFGEINELKIFWTGQSATLSCAYFSSTRVCRKWALHALPRREIVILMNWSRFYCLYKKKNKAENAVAGYFDPTKYVHISRTLHFVGSSIRSVCY